MGNGYTDLIITRDLSAPVEPPQWPAGFQCVLVPSRTDRYFNDLNAFCDSCGFPAGWVGEMLDSGATGWALLAQDNSRPDPLVIGTGWMTHLPFYIEESGWTLDPGVDGAYVFGDFIDDAWRGRGLQKQMLRQRLAYEAAAGVRWVYGVARWNNAPSLTSCGKAGFVVAARVGVRFVGPLRIERCKRVTPSLPIGKIARRGIGLPLGFRLRWRNH